MAHKGIGLGGWAAKYRDINWNKLRKPSYSSVEQIKKFVAGRKCRYSEQNVKRVMSPFVVGQYFGHVVHTTIGLIKEIKSEWMH